ncbi:RNA-binding protein [Multifurca ochricompacta]|uniref:H/ACA ribonucleoprotein complex subunit 2 n=1 Tax=Multifurca ochricompacta TaxID=376703 RepID=A0AAD4ME52_9AGAM|nr:RNA-binding protein [Multifurca ochricompacta]
MAKDKSEKKKVSISEAGNGGLEEDVEMKEMGEMKVSKSLLKEETAEITIPIEDLSPIAHPLAQKKLLKRIHKTVKRASKARQVKRGVKEVAKAIRKGEKGLLILAADITPIDIISHLPILSEEAQIPYIFIPSKEELGHASSTKRPTSCVMICPDSKRGNKSKGGEDDKGDYRELYDQCFKEVSKLDQRAVF